MIDLLKNNYTFRLFKKRPSFIEGFCFMLDISPNINRYNESKTSNEADTEALRSDWYAIGYDLWQTVEKYKNESKRKSK